MDLVELARFANIALGTWLFSYCTMRTVRDWPKWTRREKAVRVHLTAYLFVMTAGTALVLWDVNPVTRVLLLLTVHTSFALALWRNRNDPVR
jgi:hypothetical protein